MIPVAAAGARVRQALEAAEFCVLGPAGGETWHVARFRILDALFPEEGHTVWWLAQLVRPARQAGAS